MSMGRNEQAFYIQRLANWQNRKDKKYHFIKVY